MEIKTSEEIYREVNKLPIDKPVLKKWVAVDDIVKEIEKDLERLKGYACGYHKQLEKQMLNRIKKLNSQSNENKKEAD